MFKSTCISVIAMTTSGAALAQAPTDTSVLAEKAKRQLECAALYGAMVAVYPENGQTHRREGMQDAFALLRSAGQQNLTRSGATGEFADAIIRTRVEEIVKLAESEAKSEFRQLFKGCRDLYRETLHRD